MIAVDPADPKSPEATALLNASHAFLRTLYQPEYNFYLSIDDLCAPHIRFFVAGQDGVPRGCGALANYGDYGEVKSMYTDPAARGAGIGAALMERIEAEARGQGLPLLRLETGDDLYAAHRLYARCGFVLCGAFGDYTEGPHSVFMEKRLG